MTSIVHGCACVHAPTSHRYNSSARLCVRKAGHVRDTMKRETRAMGAPLTHAVVPAGSDAPPRRFRRLCDAPIGCLPLLLMMIVLLTGSVPVDAQPKVPNILFVIMDDVGIDQMRVFGYGGATPPHTPNIDTIARAGVRFHNAWSMPACSASRATMFTGRYPLRTNVFDALGPFDIANSHVSRYEMTTPKLLKNSGYKSALFGKFHLGLQNNNPFGDGMPHALGWDYFSGWLDATGDPSSIDTTA